MKGSVVTVVKEFFEYDTPKYVHIKSHRVGVIYRLCQLTIIGYIIGYVIVWNKGYQDFDTVVSATTTKVKGVAQTNYTALNISGPDNMTFRIWDVADYVIPPQESDAFFVMTNVIYTPNQTQQKCPEDPQYIRCHNDSDCRAGAPVVNGNGIQTGLCVNSTINTSVKVCEIYAWCPVEIDELPAGNNETLLQGTEDFTVLIKNNIEFPKFGVKTRNIIDTQNQTYLQSCKYNKSDDGDKYCPVFRLGSIVDETKPGSSYKDIAVVGGVIGININWDCNLDHSIKICRPVYTFSRLDDAQAKIAKGTNFRYANYYNRDGSSYRDLFKAYGIRFIIRVTGRGGRFSIVPLLLNIGSGIGLLAIAAVIGDIVTLYMLDKRSYYKDNKYQYLGEASNDDNCNAVVDDNIPIDGEEDDPLLDGGTTSH